MNQTSHSSTLPRSSGLPRPSRLPVSRSTFNPPPLPTIPIKYHAGVPRSKGSSGSHGGPDGVREPNQGTGAVNNSDIEVSTSLQGLDSTLSQSDAAEIQSLGEEHGQRDSQDETIRRRPRPSLSDRTIETLSQIPPSPSPSRRKSGFFAIQSPERIPPHPSSSMSRPRPNTSHGHRTNLPSVAPPSTSPVKRSINPTPFMIVTPSKSQPSRRAASSYVPKSLAHSSTNLGPRPEDTPSKKPMLVNNTPLHPAAVSRMSKPPLKTMTGSKTYAPRSSKPRPAIADAFKKPDVPDTIAGEIERRRQRDVSNQSTVSATSSVFSPASRKSSQTSQASNSPNIAPTDEHIPNSKATSSAALRDAIAKAKAAHRQAIRPVGEAHATTDEQLLAPNSRESLCKRIATARMEGHLNIAALDLTEMPSEVMSMYDLDSLEASGSAWYDTVDLTRLVAADNRFETLSEDIFPDRTTEDLQSVNDETKGTLFGALETLDLHGNMLTTLPVGLRHLVHLTHLNLSKNRLTNECFNTVVQISSLRELRLSDNSLDGAVLENLYKLENLQVLDVHNNRINDMPDNLHNLRRLRVLNMAGNRLRSVPIESLCLLPLVEVDFSRNRIGATLLPKGLEGFRRLQLLNVSSNALSCLTGDDIISMPELQYLSVSDNRLQSLPDVSSCSALRTLIAANNVLFSLPKGLETLPSLRNLDLMGNNIKQLDPQIGTMNNLSMLNITNNPLQERRFLAMNTEDIKRGLQERLLAPESDDSSHHGCEPQDIASTEGSNHLKIWPVKPGGILDRSSSSLSNIIETDLGSLTALSVRSVILDHNSLSVIPAALSLLSSTLASLRLSHNHLTGANYLPTKFLFPVLRELDLASNTIISLGPVIENISAPRLETLNVSYNRLTTLPPLRQHFPALTTVQASDNRVTDLPVETVSGLHVCNVARNDIGYLDPKLGLLEAEGLRAFVTEGNRFRVPRREIVEAGTEKLLTWLRGRIPAG
ncbi:MAG: hypothetical protein Q9195_002339 [Heterodermia aff. obscurata]